MEKNRAIELLEHLAWDRDIDRNPYGDALNMAIDALKTQLSQEGTTKGTTSDTISRQAVLEALESQRTNDRTDTGFVQNHTVNECIEQVKALQPIQPERKTGKWTLGFDNIYMEKYYYCSRCGGRKYGRREPLDYFCSNCGAKMTNK